MLECVVRFMYILVLVFLTLYVYVGWHSGVGPVCRSRITTLTECQEQQCLCTPADCCVCCPGLRGHNIIALLCHCLWPPCVADADIMFLPCGFLFCLLPLFFCSLNLCRRRLDVYYTSTHGVALLRI